MSKMSARHVADMGENVGNISRHPQCRPDMSVYNVGDISLCRPILTGMSPTCRQFLPKTSFTTLFCVVVGSIPTFRAHFVSIWCKKRDLTCLVRRTRQKKCHFGIFSVCCTKHVRRTCALFGDFVCLVYKFVSYDARPRVGISRHVSPASCTFLCRRQPWLSAKKSDTLGAGRLSADMSPTLPS